MDGINTHKATSREVQLQSTSSHDDIASVHVRDAEKTITGEAPKLKRNLKSRHIQMIAIGGTVGTGLFIGSGSALATGGPIGALLAYIFIGSVVYSVMVSLGEMATYIPVSGAFTSFATRFVDPSLGFAMGWIYWFSWSVTFALELDVAGLVIAYWAPNINNGIWIAIFFVVFTLSNLLPVNFYGEFEFWFSSIKVIFILGFWIFAICVNAGVGDQGYLGFRYWTNPGPFVAYLYEDRPALGKFVGFWAVLIKAAFAFQGTELVGITAGEAENPRTTVPAAIKTTAYRILLLFCLTIFFLGILIPSDNENLLSDSSDASASPFVIAANLAGIKALPSIINAVLLTAILSAANSNVYSGSRILVGLSKEGCAPSLFQRASKGGVPYYAVLATAMIGLLGFLNLSSTGTKVFDWLLNITAVAGLIVWAGISVCHISFMKALVAQGTSRDALPYKAPWQPYLAWYSLFFNVLIIFTQGFTAFIPWDTVNFFIAYISLIIFTVLYFGHKLIYRPKFVASKDADLDGGRREADDDTFEKPVPTTLWGKVKAWI